MIETGTVKQFTAVAAVGIDGFRDHQHRRRQNGKMGGKRHNSF
jgi:hypothetical protein